MLSDDRMWPKIPAELKYVELRLPGTFRELVANRSFSDAEIGKIVRCLALDTDFFLTQKIEAEVLYYRQHLIRKNQTRLRVEALRRRRKEAKAGALAAAMNAGQVETDCVTVTNDDDDSYSEQKTPSIFVEKTPPIVPLEKNSSSSLEKKRHGRRKKNRGEALADSIQRDLFSMDNADASGGVRSESSGSPSGSPTMSRNDNTGTSMGQHVECPQNRNFKGVDTRVDVAWIPERFAMFWSRYPKKVAKGDALKAFTKLIKVQPDVEVFMKTMLGSLEWWKMQQSWTKDGGKFIPYPATWLNGGHWEDIKDNPSCQSEFAKEDVENISDDELVKRMIGE